MTATPENIQQLVAEIQKVLLARGEMLATAESCTGGLIASEIVNVAGSSAVFAGGGAEIDDEIGGAHRVEIVFDDDDRVAEIAEACERGDKLVVVPLVEADARLVQNIEDADEAGADLRGEADSLRFAAGEGPGLSVERQVIEPD